MSDAPDSHVLDELDRLFQELIRQQHAKVGLLARRHNPRFTDDDLEQPHDYPELVNDPAWQYEDGILAGYRSAHMAVRAQLRRRG